MSLFIAAALMPGPAAPRTAPRPEVGAGGFEPPVLDPKSSVLPLDDAPPGGPPSRPDRVTPESDPPACLAFCLASRPAPPPARRDPPAALVRPPPRPPPVSPP